MPFEKEVILVQKATAYDLLKILKDSGKGTFTREEIEAIIDACIVGVQQ